ncbi:unnamed protein product [marine sediment metagenome]|uniref:Uncharacterized protein n=1 Tax=marine sediment metagenome TaxID=412755 RepID=X1S2E1_9ZZZZ
MKRKRTIVTLQAWRKWANENQQAVERLAEMLVRAEQLIVALKDERSIQDELIGVLNRKIASLPGSDIRRVDMPGKLELYTCTIAAMGCEHIPGNDECNGCGNWQVCEVAAA